MPYIIDKKENCQTSCFYLSIQKGKKELLQEMLK